MCIRGSVSKSIFLSAKALFLESKVLMNSNYLALKSPLKQLSFLLKALKKSSAPQYHCLIKGNLKSSSKYLLQSHPLLLEYSHQSQSHPRWSEARCTLCAFSWSTQKFSLSNWADFVFLFLKSSEQLFQSLFKLFSFELSRCSSINFNEFLALNFWRSQWRIAVRIAHALRLSLDL